MCRYAQFTLSSRQLNYRGFPLILLKIIISFILIPAFLGIALFCVGRETVKAYGLSCSNHYLCHVKRAFLLFHLLWGLTRLLVAFSPRGSPSHPYAIRSARGSSQRMLLPLFVRHIAQFLLYCSMFILSTPYLCIVTIYILCFRLDRYNILCFGCFRAHNFGLSISGSSSAPLCRSAICCADCCGMPFCCPAGTGAVSAMPYATLQAKIKFAFVPV